MAPDGSWCTLCHAPANPGLEQASPPAAASGSDEPVAEPGSRLTAERIDTMLARLAADESQPATILQLGPVSLPPGRGGAVLLAGAGGLVLLAAGLLALYVLGVVI